ncbi:MULTISPECIES: GIY-YIG nuclease family protein [Methylobacterium]|uniref:Excinuclease ABC C subunit domain protein n=1 Tax=Methylobacterium aquaticum TaxID=270351 RepID=A0A0C6FL91_9HYPH|nr:excinuclease ABC C subunit domain protein [Methylobacterium aquaticum]
MNAFVYILRCADGSYYVGSARGETLDKRLSEHQTGTYPGYTRERRPVTLVYAEMFERITDAIAMERRIKGWGRAKKEALIRSDWDRLKHLARRNCVQNKLDAGTIDQKDLPETLDVVGDSHPPISS